MTGTARLVLRRRIDVRVRYLIENALVLFCSTCGRAFDREDADSRSGRCPCCRGAHRAGKTIRAARRG